MSKKQNDTIFSIFPANATTGALTVFVRPDKTEEIKKLEEERTLKMWEVRAYLSDHALLAGTALAALKERGNHSLLVKPEENPLWHPADAAESGSISYTRLRLSNRMSG